MHPDLTAALAPVLADLSATCAVRLEVSDNDRGALVGPAVMVWSADGTGTGISIDSEESPVEQLVSVTDQVQEAAIEALWLAGRPVTWPQCPRHPDTHPLEPVVASSRGIWRCPRDDTPVDDIGTLTRRPAT